MEGKDTGVPYFLYSSYAHFQQGCVVSVSFLSYLVYFLNWQLREAAILAIGTVANSLHEVANTVHEDKVFYESLAWESGLIQHTTCKFILPINKLFVKFYVLCVSLMDLIYGEVLSVVAVDLQADSLTFNFEPFLDSILAEDLGSAGEL